MADIKAGESEWCPTSHGTGTAYRPEWREQFKEDAKWREVPTRRTLDGLGNAGREGVPCPLFMGGAIAQVGLMGYAQAMALAWMYAAQAEAMGKDVEVRAAEYDLQYDVKARVRTSPPDNAVSK